MNKLVIPSSPSWFGTDIMACSPDNTLIYGSRQDLVIIKPSGEKEPDDVQCITRAHTMKIKSVNINRNWGQPHKYAVTVSEDKFVKLWDIETLEKKLSHNKHVVLEENIKVVGACFAGDDRVVSVSETGTVVVWNIVKNETNVLNSLFDHKTIVTCLSVCPHQTWLASLGLKSGLIVVADLRRTGKILYKLRGHDKEIVSLAWCPAPVNIFPIKPNSKVVEKKLEVDEEIKISNEPLSGAARSDEETSQQEQKTEVENKEIAISVSKENSDITKEETEKSSDKEFSNITETEKTDRRKQRKPKKMSNPWAELSLADGSKDVEKKDAEKIDSENDFLKDCADLKQKILRKSTPKVKVEADSDVCVPDPAPRVILKPKSKKQQCNLSNILLKKEKTLQSQAGPVPKESISDNESVDTPTDRRVISMEICDSIGQLTPGMTDHSEKSMEITTCGRKESTNTVDTILNDTDKTESALLSGTSENTEFFSDNPKLDTTTSSEESKEYSSVSSCDNDNNCSKKYFDLADNEIVKKSDTSSTSESGDVFHDAQVEPKVNKESGESPDSGENKDSDESKESGDNKEGSESQKNGSIKIEEVIALEEQPRKEFLLASSAREPNIYIWRAGTDGRMQTFLTVPNPKGQKKGRTEKLWITLCWVAPQIILSSSRNAELLQWTLPKPMVQAKFLRHIHKDHWSVLFSIKSPIVYLNEYNFLQKRDHNAWTTGMERMIVNTDIGSHKQLGCYPTFAGTVNCIAGSPLDPNRLAIGTGEGIVHVWDLSREHTKQIVFSTFYQKILSSVTALAWHPSLDTSLAWGTNEGRVGIINTAAKSKPPQILPHYFKNEIYKIEWGPLNGDVPNPGLFVVSEKKVAIFDPKSQEKDPKILEMPDNTFVYTMSWKPDYSLLLVSSKSGTLITYSPDLKLLDISYINHKLQTILWNPNAASSDISLSKFCQTFASIIKNVEIQVYDLAKQSDNMNDKIIAKFENRGVIINSIEWNPHSGNQLVLVDAVGVAQVYDIETKTVLSTYFNPNLISLTSVYWSPINPDYIITGTLGHQVIVWKVSEYAPLPEKQINSHRNKLMKAQNKAVGDEKEKIELAEQGVEEQPKPKKVSTKSSLVPIFYNRTGQTQIEDIKKLLQWKSGDKNIESNIGDNRRVVVLDIFADKTMDRVLELNIDSLKQQGRFYNSNLLTLFKGDISGAVKEAIDKKRVTPWIISMCPMVSPKLWQTACETYANQLLDEPEADPLEIVTYLLACHKVEESVNLLCDREMFREALVLAKARFGPDNSLVSEILTRWAKTMTFHGNFELAAQCYISIGKYEDAAAVLFRRSDVELLELALQLAELSGNEDLRKAVMFRYNAFKTETLNIKDSYEETRGSVSKEDQTETEIGSCRDSDVVCTEGVQKDSSKIEKTENKEHSICIQNLGSQEKLLSGLNKEELFTENSSSDQKLEVDEEKYKNEHLTQPVIKDIGEYDEKLKPETVENAEKVNGTSQEVLEIQERENQSEGNKTNSKLLENSNSDVEFSNKCKETGQLDDRQEELNNQEEPLQTAEVKEKQSTQPDFKDTGEYHERAKPEKMTEIAEEIYRTSQEVLEIQKRENKSEDSSDSDVEFSKKCKEFPSDLVKEKIDRLDDQQEVLNVQEKLLSTAEVKEEHLTQPVVKDLEEGNMKVKPETIGEIAEAMNTSFEVLDTHKRETKPKEGKENVGQSDGSNSDVEFFKKCKELPLDLVKGKIGQLDDQREVLNIQEKLLSTAEVKDERVTQPVIKDLEEGSMKVKPETIEKIAEEMNGTSAGVLDTQEGKNRSEDSKENFEHSDSINSDADLIREKVDQLDKPEMLTLHEESLLTAEVKEVLKRKRSS